MTRSQVALIQALGMDGGEGLVLVSTNGSEVLLGVSDQDAGDAEVVLTAEACEKVISALRLALEQTLTR
jgi:hypothetical protein